MEASSLTPVSSPETIQIPADVDTVCCDGGGGALGHPAVYYTLGKNGRAECGYCDRVFVKSKFR